MNFKILFFFILLINFSFEFHREKIESKYVKELNETNFNDFINNNPQVYIMFYSPWCHICKNAKPLFFESANTVHDLIPYGCVDCTINRKLCSKYNIRLYPTFEFICKMNNDNTVYKGSRSPEGHIDFVKTKMIENDKMKYEKWIKNH